MKTLLRLTAMIVLLATMSGSAFSATNLTTSTSLDAPQNIQVGNNFKFKIRYNWSGAPQGNHGFRIALNAPQSLEIVSTSISSGPEQGKNISSISNALLFDLNVSATYGQSGSGELTITVRFKSNTAAGTQACLSGTIIDEYYQFFGGSPITTSANLTGNNCVSVSAAPPCDCSGVISFNNLAGGSTKSGVAFDFGVVGSMNCNDVSACNAMVTAKVNQLSTANRQTIENNVCGSTAQNNSPIRAFAKLGSQPYVFVKDVGVLTKTPEVSTTTCMCPQGWTSNTSGVAGGVTTDGKCKKKVADMTISPAPPNTQLGTWGFSDGTDIWIWGTSANGGAKVCTTSITTQGVCKIQ